MGHLNLLAAAANAAPLPEVTFSAHFNQYFVDVLAAALSGMLQLPLVLFFVWIFRRLKVDGYLILSAFLATILSLAASVILEMIGFRFSWVVDHALTSLGLRRFFFYFMPDLLVRFFGGLGFAWWLKHRSRSDRVSTFT